MAKKQKNKTLPVIDTSTEKLVREYDEADQLLNNRIQDKRFGFDTYDKLYQTYLDPAKWPYSVKLATPRGFTALFNKTTRMIGGRYTGKVEGIERSDELGAKIATEHFKWSVERYNQFHDLPIEGNIAMWDTNARIYGAGFKRKFWKVEFKNRRNVKTGKLEKVKTYDNWAEEVINNRDLLLQPGRESIQGSDYVIHRRYVSLEQLERIQEDGADFNEDSMSELRDAKNGQGKDSNYIPVVKLVKGQDWTDTRFEVCTTYYKDKWITWVPKMGTKQKGKQALILREIDNPYLHGEIPIVPLVYIPSQEDIYGMSELQPVTALLKILSALQSQIIEVANLTLYAPTLVSPTETRIDTFKFSPKALWLVNNPAMVQKLDMKSSQSLSSFSEIYKMIVTEFLEAMGETGSGISQVDLLGGQKTATEVKDKAYIRGSRDNFNKMMLASALKRDMHLTFEMLRDPKFTDKNTLIKIVGKDALEYFDKQGLTDWGISPAGYELVMQTALELEKDDIMGGAAKQNGADLFELAYDLLTDQGALDQYASPLRPTFTPEGIKPKLDISDSGLTGYLYVDPQEDYLGNYNFIADVEALSVPDPDKEYASRAQWYEQAKMSEKEGLLARDGYQLKHKDILTKLAENLSIKEAEQYFTQAEQPNNGGGNEFIRGREAGQGIGAGGQGLPPEQTIQEPSGIPVGATGEGIPQTSGDQMAGAVPLR